jgi:endoglucanase
MLIRNPSSRCHLNSLVLAMPIICVLGMIGPAYGQMTFRGVNLSGAEFGSQNLPGTYFGDGPGPYDYIYPPASEVDYFVGKGMNIFRLPFRWERLQRTLNGSLHAAELERMKIFVDHTTGIGAHVILDPHNFAFYHGDVIGGGNVNSGHLADFWERIANEFKDNPRVIFGLMNEPIGVNQNGISTENWLEAANDSIAAIRGTGAENLILVPGNGYTGAHSWYDDYYGTPNADVMDGVIDPFDNFAFEVHQYFDQDSSGGTTGIVNSNIGRDRLIGFTNWLREHNYRGFLGEFAAGNSTIGNASNQIGDETVNTMLDYMEDNSDVWMGWAWWGGGPWWGDYIFAIDPSNGNDRSSMDLLEPRLVVSPPEVLTVDLNGSEEQRSAIETMTIRFDSDIILEEGAISIVQRSTATAETFETVDISVSPQLVDGRTVVTVQFASHTRNSDNALVDGNYQLTVDSSLVTYLGVPMTADFDFGSVEEHRFFSFYGDTDGNRIVDIFDLLTFRQTYLATDQFPSYRFFLDFDANGVVNIFDLLQFRTRYLTTIPFTFNSKSSKRSRTSSRVTGKRFQKRK